jgi:malonyl-CoA/methylmalonyl-CoA synthetase
VTLLSIFATNSIALPLAPSFPASELRYILENSGALMLLSSARFQSKAEEVIRGLVDRPPISIIVQKRPSNYPGTSLRCVHMEGARDVAAGMLLYTSGTTNRPVGNIF